LREEKDLSDRRPHWQSRFNKRSSPSSALYHRTLYYITYLVLWGMYCTVHTVSTPRSLLCRTVSQHYNEVHCSNHLMPRAVIHEKLDLPDRRRRTLIGAGQGPHINGSGPPLVAWSLGSYYIIILYNKYFILYLLLYYYYVQQYGDIVYHSIYMPSMDYCCYYCVAVLVMFKEPETPTSPSPPPPPQCRINPTYNPVQVQVLYRIEYCTYSTDSRARCQLDVYLSFVLIVKWRFYYMPPASSGPTKMHQKKILDRDRYQIHTILYSTLHTGREKARQRLILDNTGQYWTIQIKSGKRPHPHPHHIHIHITSTSPPLKSSASNPTAAEPAGMMLMMCWHLRWRLVLIMIWI